MAITANLVLYTIYALYVYISVSVCSLLKLTIQRTTTTKKDLIYEEENKAARENNNKKINHTNHANELQNYKLKITLFTTQVGAI